MTTNALQSQIQHIMDAAMRAIGDTLRSASTGEIATLFQDGQTRVQAPRQEKATRAPTRRAAPEVPRARMNDIVFDIIARASGPVGVKEIAKELKLPTAKIAPSLVLLRTKGAIIKHGDKSKTQYTAKAPDGAPVVHIQPKEQETPIAESTPPVVPEEVVHGGDEARTPVGSTNRYAKKKAKAS